MVITTGTLKTQCGSHGMLCLCRYSNIVFFSMNDDVAVVEAAAAAVVN